MIISKLITCILYITYINICMFIDIYLGDIDRRVIINRENLRAGNNYDTSYYYY